MSVERLAFFILLNLIERWFLLVMNFGVVFAGHEFWGGEGLKAHFLMETTF